ncbi:hypothetical protein HQQ80_16330 [Microbacteriaceae bacterium VKM Ac-2855]|nr:hypothetical protein [Microbacteriaceae bacterium VKM Ac-2855]
MRTSKKLLNAAVVLGIVAGSVVVAAPAQAAVTPSCSGSAGCGYRDIGFSGGTYAMTGTAPMYSLGAGHPFNDSFTGLYAKSKAITAFQHEGYTGCGVYLPAYQNLVDLRVRSCDGSTTMNDQITSWVWN